MIHKKIAFTHLRYFHEILHPKLILRTKIDYKNKTDAAKDTCYASSISPLKFIRAYTHLYKYSNDVMQKWKEWIQNKGIDISKATTIIYKLAKLMLHTNEECWYKGIINIVLST